MWFRLDEESDAFVVASVVHPTLSTASCFTCTAVSVTIVLPLVVGLGLRTILLASVVELDVPVFRRLSEVFDTPSTVLLAVSPGLTCAFAVEELDLVAGACNNGLFPLLLTVLLGSCTAESFF